MREGGWGKGGGVMGGVRGWNLYINEVFNKTGIVSLSLVIVMHVTRRNRPKIAISRGFPNFGGNPHCNDIIISQKRHVLASKSPKTRCAGDFMVLHNPMRKKGSHLDLIFLSHLRISNSIFAVMESNFH